MMLFSFLWVIKLTPTDPKGDSTGGMLTLRAVLSPCLARSLYVPSLLAKLEVEAQGDR